MPSDKPRYLMGVGTPRDLLTAIGAGIDMFDCVMPTRNARNGQLFVREGGLNVGRLNIANAQYRDDARPVEEGCPCECCASYGRAYLSHLFHAKELLYYRLATVHNLQHYLDLARRARAAIIAGVVHDSSW
jgi:queuine tRNA-ribosyltransferase